MLPDAIRIDGLIALALGAVSTLVRMFETPFVRGLIGPATKFALEGIQGK